MAKSKEEMEGEAARKAEAFLGVSLVAKATSPKGRDRKARERAWEVFSRSVTPP